MSLPSQARLVLGWTASGIVFLMLGAIAVAAVYDVFNDDLGPFAVGFKLLLAVILGVTAMRLIWPSMPAWLLGVRFYSLGVVLVGMAGSFLWLLAHP